MSQKRKEREGKVAVQVFVTPEQYRRFKAACALSDMDIHHATDVLFQKYADDAGIPSVEPPKSALSRPRHTALPQPDAKRKR